MASLELRFSKNAYLTLLAEEIDIAEFLNEVFEGRISDDQSSIDSQIGGALLDYHMGSGGAPSVYEWEMETCSYDSATKKGSITFDYDVYHYYGCEDMNTLHNHIETYAFSVNIPALTLTIHFTEDTERSTYEEF